jgi:penicillin amidase
MRTAPVALALSLAFAVLVATAPPARAPGLPPAPPLEHPVRVSTDRWGIPHLQAQTLGDLYLAWGYVTARDRLWQLAYQRRAGQGRLAEWFGHHALTADGGAQLFRLAERAAAIWSRERRDPAVRLAFERYADGINTWLARCRAGASPWPPELRALGARVEDWRPEDSVLLLLGMGVQLDLDLPELREARDAARLGAEWVATRRRYESRWTYETVPSARGTAAARRDGPRPAVPADERLARLAGRAAERLAGLLRPDDEDGARRASNAFAVGAARSASGVPVLANDPHLGLSTPGAFHVVHVSIPGEQEAAGACVPGLPVIVSGRNRDCAWGVTALSADVLDVYADTLSSDGRRVRHAGGWVEIQERPYALRWRWLGIPIPVPGQVRRYTPHGPVVSHDRGARLVLSVRWSALEDARITLGRLVGLERARDAQEVVDRFSTLVTPTLNVLAADRGGRVRYRACGLVPRRARDPGPGPLPGDGRHEWTGFVPASRMPAWSPPPGGFVVNANNRPVAPAPGLSWPRFDWAHDRALRIHQRLAGDRSITAADLRSVQNDVRSGMAGRFVPRLVACADSLSSGLSPRARAALDTLRGWDFTTRRDRVAPALWRAWFVALHRRWGMEGLPARVLATLEGEAHDWPRGHAPETPARAAAAALDTALADLERLLGPDLATWRWGRAHRARFRHDFTRWGRNAAGLEPPTVPVDGDNATPCVGPSRLPGSIEVGHGAVFRHVVDLAIEDSSWVVVPPGNTFAGPRLARAQLTAWRDHALVPLLLDPERIARERVDDLVLGPAGLGSAPARARQPGASRRSRGYSM